MIKLRTNISWKKPLRSLSSTSYLKGKGHSEEKEIPPLKKNKNPLSLHMFTELISTRNEIWFYIKQMFLGAYNIEFSDDSNFYMGKGIFSTVKCQTSVCDKKSI